MIKWIKRNYIVLFVLCVVTAFLFFSSYYVDTRYVGDTALYGQITKNIAYTGRAESNIYANTIDFINRGIAGMSVEDILDNDDVLIPPKTQSRNILSFHACYILYLVAPLCYFVSDFTCLTLVQALALSLSIVFLILLMREKQLPILIIILACILFASHPGWSIPAVYGAFYPERIFMGTGMYLVWALDKQRFSKFHFCFSTLLCCLVGERGALYAGMFILAYTVFFWKEKRSDKALRISLGIGAVLYFFLMIKYVLDNLYYTGLGSKINIFSYLKNETNIARIGLFLFINVVLFLSLSLLDWKAFIIAFASMIPNILYDVGGAEKLGWSLHYHVFYFVFLMWAVMRGIVAINKLLEIRFGSRTLRFVSLSGLCLTFIVLISTVSPYDVGVSFKIDNVKNNVFICGSTCINRYYIKGEKSIREEFDEFVLSHVKKNDTISTIEEGMPVLTNHHIYLYPLGLDTANAVLLSYYEDEDGIHFCGSPIYASSEEDSKYFDNQMILRMGEMGYDIDNPSLFPAYGKAIITR